MFELNSFRETVEALAACSDDRALWQRYAWVYVQGDTALLESRFYLVSNLDEDDERRDRPDRLRLLDDLRPGDVVRPVNSASDRRYFVELRRGLRVKQEVVTAREFAAGEG